MVEVFKTDVQNEIHATLLLEQMHKAFLSYKANFDLDDCDNILRVESEIELVQSSQIIDFLKTLGCTAEILPDEVNLLFG